MQTRHCNRAAAAAVRVFSKGETQPSHMHGGLLFFSCCVALLTPCFALLAPSLDITLHRAVLNAPAVSRLALLTVKNTSSRSLKVMTCGSKVIATTSA
jgi:hypothetical protein